MSEWQEAEFQTAVDQFMQQPPSLGASAARSEFVLFGLFNHLSIQLFFTRCRRVKFIFRWRSIMSCRFTGILIG
jgi:hypothetical protein